MSLSLAERRRILIRIASARQKPGTGSCQEFLKRRTSDVLWPDLSQTMGNIAWAVIGGVGTRHYMPERATRDLDILVHCADSGRVATALTASTHTRIADLKIGGSTWRAPDGMYVDVIESDAGWVRRALMEAASNHDLQGLPVLPLPYLSLMKFQAGRAQDLADLTRMLGLATEEQRAAVRRVFVTYESAGLEDLESLIALGRLENAGE